MWGRGRRGQQVSSSVVDLTLHLRRCLVLNRTRCLNEAGWLSNSQDLSLSTLTLHPPVLGLQACIAVSSFLHGYWGFKLKSSRLPGKCSCPLNHLLSHLPSLVSFFLFYYLKTHLVFLLNFWKKNVLKCFRFFLKKCVYGCLFTCMFV